MLKDIRYNRSETVKYAERWAYDRNPKYLNFDDLGGDCTNFASQCIFAGCRVMNYTPIFGWYYNSSKDHTPSWNDVQSLYSFLINNKNVGPYAIVTTASYIEIGDIILLGDDNGHYYHSLIVTAVTTNGLFVSAHSIDAYMRPLDSYVFNKIRYLHVLGARVNI